MLTLGLWPGPLSNALTAPGRELNPMGYSIVIYAALTTWCAA